MRVLLVSFVDDNRWSGMGKWTHCIAHGLKQLGHQPTAWFSNDFPALQHRWRWAVLLFPVVLAWRIWRRRSDFDAVVIHEPGGFWYGLMRRLRLPVPPMVAMCHNVESKHFYEMVDFTAAGLATIPRATRIKVPLFRLWQSDGAIRFSDHVICLSSIDRDYLRQRLGIPSERITRMANGVSAVNIAARPRSASGSRVLFVGGWLDVKGRCVLPSLWAKVRAQSPESTLTILGAGQSADTVLADFAAEHRSSITVIVRLTGEAELIDQYARHDVFLMPSLSEGSSLALLEAMAAGMPVVATRAGGIPDVIAHESNGLLFNTSNTDEGAAQVCRLLTQPELSMRLGLAARTSAQERTWLDTCRVFLSAVDKVVGNCSATAIAEDCPPPARTLENL